MPWRLWPLIRDRHATLGEVFGRLFGDNEAVKLALASNLGYYTDDADTMPFIQFAVPQASYLTGGGHYVRGGSQVLSDRLVAIIREAGGKVEAGREVETILLDGDRTRGVRHRAHKTGDIRGGTRAGHVRKCRAGGSGDHAAGRQARHASCRVTRAGVRRSRCGPCRSG